MRKRAGWILGAAFCVAAASFLLWLRPARIKTRPSFLVIVIDSVRADHVGAYGYPRPTTPRLDALAREGILFENTFSQAPWTKPSVASIFTSSYASVHRVLYSKRVVNGEDRTDVLNPKFLTLAEAMKAGGWATGGFGQKIHLRPEFGFDQGFDRYDMHARRAEMINKQAIEWLRGGDPEKFFIYLHYNDPHYPYKPRPPYDRFGTTTARVQIEGETKKAFREGRLRLTPEDIRQLLDLYDGEILYADAMVGELLDTLGRMGYRNLTVIVTADHGEEFLDHGDITHGQSLYAELVRVPFILGGTGLPASARGRRSAETVELIDIMPTLIEMAGLPRPPGLQGKSLAPLLLAAAPGRSQAPGTAIFSERRDPDDTEFSSTVFDGRWKFIHDVQHNRTLLFDIAADPGETLPLAGGNDAVVSALRGYMDRWAATNRSLYQKIGPEDDRPLDPETEQKLRSLGYVQ